MGTEDVTLRCVDLASTAPEPFATLAAELLREESRDVLLAPARQARVLRHMRLPLTPQKELRHSAFGMLMELKAEIKGKRIEKG